jgi:hypothetical protein
MPLNSKLNGDVLNKVVLAVIGLAVAGSWGFLTSRASRICQFLDRKDKDEGGPGLECKDPE